MASSASILGGGRYDNLVGDVGGDRVPGVGFAMGDMVMGLVAQKYQKVPALRASPADVLVTIFDKNSVAESLRLAAELRAGGRAKPSGIPSQPSWTGSSSTPTLLACGLPRLWGQMSRPRTR